jgi:hypothetical protein
VHNNCPTDAFQPGTTACRPAAPGDAGACDQTEFCTGTGASCPPDAFKPNTTVCRTANGQCDVAESCSGNGPACPTDAFKPNTADCNDGRFCTTGDKCDGFGQCVGGPPPSCNDDNACTTDVCNTETDTCDHASVQPACEGKMTGGGQILVNRNNRNDKRSFGFNARGTALLVGGASGHFNYLNHATGQHFNGPVTFIYYATPSPTGGAMKFEVTTSEGCKYNVTAEDQAEPGSKSPYDWLTVEWTFSPPLNTTCPTDNTDRQRLDAGNIQWHRQ